MLIDILDRLQDAEERLYQFSKIRIGREKEAEKQRALNDKKEE